ncbi:MAG: hypothetical protein LQ346_003757 [Caloplaca aetnensis]|nr:MAG: hypothetical protein LQ346_003757 [Caloplaca aetnensis]
MQAPEEDDGDSSDLPDVEQVINAALSARGMLPSSSPPKKRQRTGPSSALHKPFRSPFKTPLKSSAESSQSTAGLTPQFPGDSAERDAPPILTPTPGSSRRKSPTRLNGFKSSPHSFAAPSPHLDKLQKRHTALINELSSLRANLETTNQALEIEASNTDTELETLIRKWKTVSRDAAEEVYIAAKERVDGAGGVKALKKKEKEMKQGWGWEEKREGDQRTYDDDDLGPDDGAQDSGAEKEIADRGADGADEDEEGFTMEMMLRSLDIPLELIGYDKAQQRWTE